VAAITTQGNLSKLLKPRATNPEGNETTKRRTHKGSDIMAKEQEEKISADYLSFIEWEAMTYEEKVEHELPTSLDGYAAKIGKAQKTLSAWRKKEGHWPRVMKCYEKGKSKKTRQVRERLYELTQGVEVEHQKEIGEIVVTKVYTKPPDPKAI